MKFKRVTRESLFATENLAMPIGYLAKVKCVCGNTFISHGAGYCTECDMGIVIVSADEMFSPVAVWEKDSLDIQDMDAPEIVEWIEDLVTEINWTEVE